MSYRRLEFAFVIILVAALLVIGAFLGKGWENKVSAETEVFEELKVFSEVLSIIQKNYVEPVESKELIYGAIKGLIGTLDPHSAFMNPEIYREVQVDTKGEFGGLGLQVGIKDNRLVVIAPIEGTPADEAGIEAGDWIIKVDDVTTKDMTLMDAVNQMRGPKGSTVVLTIAREGIEEPLAFSITRDIIRIDSVKGKVLEAGIGYIRISQFQERTVKELKKEINKLKDEKVHSMILDLRNNPGGLLSAAVEVSEQFLERGKMIVSIKGRDGKKDEYFSGGDKALADIPMIVLVNAGSASASEIVAGALQEWGKALVLGTQTFGKGSVQTILPLSDGSALRLTTAKYYTPKGRSIQNTGINPDIVVKASVAQARNLPVIREKDLERHLENDTRSLSDAGEESNLPEKGGREGAELDTVPLGEKEDLQLNKAVDLLKTWEVFKDLLPRQNL